MTHRPSPTRWRAAVMAASLLTVLTFLPAASSPAGAARQRVAAASAASQPLFTPQLLANPSFEQGLAPWTLAPQTNVALYQGSAAEDATYLETNAGAVGGGVAQTVSTTPVARHAYQAQVMLRSPEGLPVGVGLALVAAGSGLPTVSATTAATIRSRAWRSVPVSLKVPAPGYQSLIVVLYLTSTGVNLDADAASLQDAGVADPSFSQGFAGWHNHGANVAVYHGPAVDGSHFLEVNGAGRGGWVATDVATAPVVGHTYRASMWVRSPTGAKESVTVGLKALGSTTEGAVTTTKVSSRSWTRIRVALDITSGGHDALRVSFRPGARNIDIDGVSLEDAGLANASFEQSISGWSVTPGANVADYPGRFEDAHFVQTNTGGAGPGAGLLQTVPATVVQGDAYRGSVALRSATAGPVQARVLLWATGGGAGAQVASTAVTLRSRAWTDVPVELDPSAAGFTDLSVEVAVDTPGANVDLDAASLSQAPAPGGGDPLSGAIVTDSESQDQYHANVTATPISSDCNPYSAYWGVGTPCGPGLNAQPWCASFAAWVWQQAGVPFTWGYGGGDLNAESYSFVSWGQAHGTFTTTDPQPGDAVVWGDASTGYGQHVGIITGVDNGQIDVVSGNWSNRVWDEGYFDPTTSNVAGYPLIGYVSPVPLQPAYALPAHSASAAPALSSRGTEAQAPASAATLRQTPAQRQQEIARQHAP